MRIAATASTAALLAGAAVFSPSATAIPTDVVFPGTNETLTPLEEDVLAAVAEADFSSTYDFDAGAVSAHTPNVDVAVIELDADGNIRDRANILVSRDYPDGVVAPIDRHLSSSSVRWLRWEQGRFDGSGYGSGSDIVPGREDAPLRYMASYPASLLKSMAAFGLVFLSDHGVIDVNSNYTYNGVTKSITTWTEEMIQYSNNTSSQAMIKMLHEVQYEGVSGIRYLNDELQRLGMKSLQLEGTSASTGGGWSNGGVNMTSFDTAKLDLLLDGGNGGVLWTNPDGSEVTADVLSDEGRDWLLDIWSGTAYHWMLDTGNFCNWTTPYTGDRQYPAMGIPAVVPESTLNPDGTSKIQWAGSPFATIDIRPCNDQAEVTFFNKYGLTYNAGSDAGIVKNLPDKPFRHYIVSVMTNIGYRYGDIEMAALGNACLHNDSSFCYTEKLPIMAGQIDAAIKARGETPAKTATATSLELSTSAAIYPEAVTATATVSGGVSGIPVEFYNGDEKLGEAIPGSDGVAAFETALVPGEHSLIAHYPGSDSTFLSTSSEASLTVAKGDPAFTLSVAEVGYGTAAVAKAQLIADASGSVEFFDDSTSLGVVAVADGIAELELPDLGVGAHAIRAEYSGDEHYEPASGLTAVAVNKVGTISTLSLSSAVYGQAVSAVATVSSASAGQVAFTVNGQPSGIVNLSAGKALTRISGLDAGRHTVTASFLGSDTHEVSFVVGQARVAKAAPKKVTVKAKKRARNARPQLIVKVAKLNNGSAPAGKIQVRVGKKKVRTVKIRPKTNGKVKVKLPRRYGKKIVVRAKFVPDDRSNVKSKTSKKLRVKPTK